MDGLDIAAHIIKRGEEIEREKHGHALTTVEASMVTAAAFLRKIAPYLGESPESVDEPPTRITASTDDADGQWPLI